MYSPITIANFFIVKGIECDEPITQMKVQKLVYISHGWYLAATDEPLIDSVVEAWKFGPVIPEIYHKLKYFGNNPITVPISSEEVKEKEIRDFLDFIWLSYGKYTAVYLSNLTHQDNTPWSEVAKHYSYNIPKNKDIDNDLIQRHFKGLVQDKEVTTA